MAPIVIISDFDEAALNRFTHEANILFTDGIYLCNNTKEDIQKYQNVSLRGLKYYDEFLNDIKILPPKDTSGTHDIANKWSIYRWAEFLEAKGDAIDKNKSEIENELYFKYLKALYANKATKNIVIDKPTKKGKVLLIDDEWDKGWKDIIQKSLSNEKIEFDYLDYQFKDKDFTKFSFSVIGIKIKEFDPDVVVLDLRLAQSDHENENIDNYTGVKILQKIHEINAGIQVIMLTATSKSTTLEKLYEKKILGYIKKEHPEDSSIDTVENINKFVRLIDDGLDSKYLKEIYILQKSIVSNENLSEDITLEVNTVFTILNSNMENRYNFAVLTFSKIFEYISKLYINEYSMKYLDNNQSVGIYDFINNTITAYSSEKWYKNTQNRLHNIIHERLNITNEKTHRYICEIINCRNYIAHPNEKKPVGCKLIKTPNHQHILNWFKIVENILVRLGQNMS